jgi:hypothetical protein
MLDSDEYNQEKWEGQGVCVYERYGVVILSTAVVKEGLTKVMLVKT